jgi:hypothetical protein
MDGAKPLVVFGRPTQEWISRVDQQQRRFAEVNQDPARRVLVDRRLEVEFVFWTLKLTGGEVARDEVRRLVSAGSPDDANGNQQCVGLIRSLRTIRELARARGPAASLTPDVLTTICELSAGSAGLRQSEGNPPMPEGFPPAIELACQWFTAESFSELHPVEQAAIVLLRLIEIHPLQPATERAAIIAASLYTLRKECPPIIITSALHQSYRAALIEGTMMNTKPMVELIADSVLTGMSEALKESGCEP